MVDDVPESRTTKTYINDSVTVDMVVMSASKLDDYSWFYFNDIGNQDVARSNANHGDEHRSRLEYVGIAI